MEVMKRLLESAGSQSKDEISRNELLNTISAINSFSYDHLNMKTKSLSNRRLEELKGLLLTGLYEFEEVLTAI